MPIANYPLQGTIGSSLLPKRYDIEIYQGDSFEVILNFKDASNVGVNLTGFTGKVQFKDDAAAVVATPVVTLNYGSVNGAVRVFLADTSTIPAGVYNWDLELTDATSRKRTYIGGKVTVTEDVTE